MKGITQACFAACLVQTSLAALDMREATPRVLQTDIQRKQISDPVQRDRRRLAKRQSKTINQALDNEETLYFANVTIGTPEQSLRLHVDTGSSDLWVNTPDSKICTYRNEGICDAAGTYSPNSSSTYEYLNSLFRITYADGSGAQGDYVTDNVKIGGSTLNAQTFAIGYSSSSEEGILGIGYATNEASLGVRGGAQYTNVPQKMVQQGLISANAYSLWLNDLDASTGAILFGGVNTEKYTGSLQTLPIIQTNGVYSAFYIALTGLGLDSKAGSVASNQKIAVLLDSGSSLTYLPDTLANSVFSALGVTYDSSQGAAIIDCDQANSNRNLVFTFSSPTITVDMSELVLNVGTSSSGQDTCILGIAPAGNSNAVLGDTFLRSAYVVYDISSNEIAIAQTNFNSTTDNIMEIGGSTSTSSGIPDATGVANAVSSVPSNPEGGARIGSSGTTVSSIAAAATKAPVAKYVSGMGAVAAVAALAF